MEDGETAEHKEVTRLKHLVLGNLTLTSEELMETYSKILTDFIKKICMERKLIYSSFLMVVLDGLM